MIEKLLNSKKTCVTNFKSQFKKAVLSNIKTMEYGTDTRTTRHNKLNRQY